MANVTINGQSYTGITSVKLLKTGTVDQYEELKADAGTNLADVEIFVGDLTDSTSYTIAKGAVDGYKRTIIS